MPTGGSDRGKVAAKSDEGRGSEAGNPLVDGCGSRVRSRNSPQSDRFVGPKLSRPRIPSERARIESATRSHPPADY